MRIIFTGDVVGRTGRRALCRAIATWRAEYSPDLVVANGENAAAGRGITPALAQELLDGGADVLTLGDHAWDQAEYIAHANELPRVLRPFNLQPGMPGSGSTTLSVAGGRVGILCLQGMALMRPGALNPFTVGYEEVARLRGEGVSVLLVDFHAESSAEKVALGYRLDGIASAVFGTHTHVPTADARILPGGTAYITDVGMCGSRDGVIGRDASETLESLVNGLPSKLPVGKWPAMVCAAMVDVDTETGRATALRPLILTMEEEDG